MRTDLELFTRQMVNYIVDSLEEAVINPAWRQAAVEEAREGWARLSRRLARDDVSHELQAISARLALLFQVKGFPTCGTFDPAQVEENRCIEAKIRELVEEIDGIYSGNSLGPTPLQRNGIADA